MHLWMLEMNINIRSRFKTSISFLKFVIRNRIKLYESIAGVCATKAKQI